ncbi:MAG: nuclear transport factor 2 family protein [Terracidiphilus sp.]
MIFRSVACISVFSLLCCSAAAQNPVSAQASTEIQSAATTTTSPEILQFQKIENAWSDALNRRDQYSLELVLSPLFVGVSAGGDITTRDQQIAQLISSNDPTFHLEQRVIAVRLLGDIAVANGTYVLHHKVGSVQVDQKGVFTHVFERVHGVWQCVNSQRTEVREEPTAKHKKEPGSAMPFHIPFFGKGDKENH